MPERSDEFLATLQRDPLYRKLSKQHRSYEDRLEELCKKHYLSEDERIESRTIKKKKLVLKDQMEEIARNYKGDHH